MTTPTLAILTTLMHAASDDPHYGLRICELTELGSGTVYPVLDRLERAGWITGEWEAEQPVGRPKRRSYRMTGEGQAAFERVLAERALRRRPAWARKTAVVEGGRP